MNTAEVIKFPGPEPGQYRSNRMENQKTGFVPLYRSIKKQSWAKDVYLRTLWENLLFDAARQPYTANFKGNLWQLESGQLVTTSADLGLALCDRNGEPTSRHAVERMLSFFEKEGMISVRAERRKGTLITVLNYTEYAEKMASDPAHNTAHMSAHNKLSAGAASEVYPAHKGAHRPAHHEQEGNNNNKNKPPKPPRGKLSGFDPLVVTIPSWLSPVAWQEWVQYRNEMGKPIRSQLTATKAFNTLKTCSDKGYDPVDVINTSIANGWVGLFEPKHPPAKKHDAQTPHWNSPEGWKDFI